jgi:hypothetical protein
MIDKKLFRYGFSAFLTIPAGCSYTFFAKNGPNDDRLTCADIEQELAATENTINRGFLKEWGPYVRGAEIWPDRTRSRNSAIERNKVLQSLRGDRC